jgi:hypothetical protein
MVRIHDEKEHRKKYEHAKKLHTSRIQNNSKRLMISISTKQQFKYKMLHTQHSQWNHHY